MRALLRLALVFGVLVVSAPALAASGGTGHAGPPPPHSNLPHFSSDTAPPPPSPGYSMTAIVFLGVLALVAFAICAWFFRRMARDMGLPADEADLARVAGPGAAVSPRETVFNAVSRAGAWVTPGRVAMGAGISTQEAEGYLEELARDGRVKAGRDKQGRILYRLPS